MCPSLGVHGTRDRDGTDAVGTALTDDWEIDVICSLARSLVRSLDRTNEGAISRPIDRIDLFASGISSRVRAFVPSCIHSFILSFIRTVDFHHHGGGFGQRGTGDADEGDRGGGVVESERGGVE
tara:strand:+ start:84 stop:455 length:372 start_codon:yes stop_codon:yes gene_type:complete